MMPLRYFRACRNATDRFRCAVLFLFLVLPQVSAAADFTVLAGATGSPEASETTYGWQVDARYNLASPFALSASWINEGHLTGHHRDGLAAQIWGRTPLLWNRISFAFGAGIYQYFDTEDRPEGGHTNEHGTAPVYSASASYYTESPFLFRFQVNHIHPTRDIDTTALLLGVGYRLFEEGGRTPVEPPAGEATPVPYETGTEATLFLGAVIQNSLESDQGVAGELEVRRGIGRHFDLSLAMIGEDNGEEIRRAGLACQIWIVDSFLDRRLVLGIGAGPYPYVDWAPSNGDSRRIDFAGLVTLGAGYRFADRWIARFHWNRVATRDERDTDMFLFGIGYRWNL